MPWLDIAVAAGLVATLITGFATRKRSLLPVAAVGIMTLAGLGVAFWMEGTRWQVIALAVAGLFVAGAVAWARSGRLTVLSRVGGTAVVVAIAILAGAAWGLPPVHVPAPSGPQTVSVTTTVWVDDSRGSRGEDGAEAADGTRSIPATVWYPASASGDAAAYLADRDRVDGLTEALAAQYGMPALVFDGLARARTNASADAAPAEGRFPVVIASPGSGSTRWLMTSWAEELASHGVIVVGIDHPYDSAGAELADGSTAESELVATGDDERDQAAADLSATIRADDISAVIDLVDRGESGVPALDHADTSHFIAAGHSLGGAAAVEAARLDERIRGVIDIDGMPRSADASPLGVPAIFLVAGDADANPEYDAAVQKFLGDDAVRVTLGGVAHLGFVDAGLLLAPVPTITGVRGPDGPRLAADATLILVDAVTSGEVVDREALGRIGTAD
ncbi:alpha/beta hydrolase family protein [Microbacterium sp. PMB16]|uniref:alpha/beta hydrolase family protein n=1 Tax=Microbacterium sp. PMB16 TaxID=3120157 RepID=UPI003F4CAD40